MGLWALTTECVQGLRRSHWGTKIEGSDGVLRDTGVQPAIEELINRLSSQSPIQMPGPLVLIKPANAPAIKIVSDGTGAAITVNNTNIITDGGDGGTTGATVSVDLLEDVAVSSAVINSCADLEITLTLTVKTLAFENGLLTSVS
jgi:hypothetical protein